MRCAANTHKPSFHVNTSIASSKYNSGKGTNPGQKGGRMPNVEDCMTEEEFFEWFQNAMQAGVFDNMNGGPHNESPSSKPENNGAKSGGGGGSGSKRKKKGKKQWWETRPRFGNRLCKRISSEPDEEETCMMAIFLR